MSHDETDLWRGDRIGVFGGTFDPPHTGHVRMAQHARETLGLDRVLFSVAPRPPHKSSDRMSTLAQRTEMVRLAIEGLDGIGVTRIEEDHETSYTVDLLRACRMRTRADLYFIAGGDSLAEMPTWKDPSGILALATLVVFAREQGAVRLDVPGPAGLVIFDSPRFDISSTALRRQLAAGTPADESLGPRVAEYAALHGLYRGSG
jgi:nicotinate-nucleotide adenylyltransferase